MSAAAITMIVLYSLAIGMAIVRHGKPRDGNHNLWATLTSVAISAVILWCGGFWR